MDVYNLKRVILASLAISSFLFLITALVFAEDQSLDKFKNLNTLKKEVIAEKGIVTANNPLSATAGAHILAKGGNAADAAIATFFANSVVLPHMVSPFSGGFVNLLTKDGKRVFIDNYAVAPASATPNMYRLCYPDDEGKQAEGGAHCTAGNLNFIGAKSIGVPGGMKAWLYVLKHHGSGKLSLRQIMQPAIDLAKNGFSVSAVLNETISRYAATSANNTTCGNYPGWVQEFLPNGHVPKVGDVLKRPAFAFTLEALADAAPAGSTFDQQLEATGTRFYKGDIAQNIVKHLQVNGGDITIDDMAWYYGSGLDDVSMNQGLRLREPVVGEYRGYQIIGPGLVSSGGALIVEMLNILEKFNLGALGFGDPQTLFYMAEAMKIAWADRDKYMGDPDYAHKDPSCPYPPPPVQGLTSKEYAEERRKEIQWPKPGTYKPGVFYSQLDSEGTLSAPYNPSPSVSEHHSTTHVTAADSEGNVITMTQTLQALWGSCVVLPSLSGPIPGSGMVLNDLMSLFDPDPRCGYEFANGIAPRKRQLSSMSPTIILKDGAPLMAIGTPGGARIFDAVMQGIINVIDHGMNIQQAVEAPRIWTMSRGPLNVEYGFPPEIVTKLKNLGYSVTQVRNVANGMNGILFDQKSKLMHGGACWREDGAGAGWSGGDALSSSFNYPPSWDKEGFYK